MERTLRVTTEAERDDAIETLERRREAVLSAARKLAEVEQQVHAFEERLKVRTPRHGAEARAPAEIDPLSTRVAAWEQRWLGAGGAGLTPERSTRKTRSCGSSEFARGRRAAHLRRVRSDRSPRGRPVTRWVTRRAAGTKTTTTFSPRSRAEPGPRRAEDRWRNAFWPRCGCPPGRLAPLCRDGTRSRYARNSHSCRHMGQQGISWPWDCCDSSHFMMHGM